MLLIFVLLLLAYAFYVGIAYDKNNDFWNALITPARDIFNFFEKRLKK